jgi:hypothetical protein
MKNDSLLDAAKTILTAPLVESTVELQEAMSKPYKEKYEDIIFLDDFNMTHIKQLRYDVVGKKMTYQTSHLAHVNDMPNPPSGSATYYVFDTPQTFTAPALIPIKS